MHSNQLPTDSSFTHFHSGDLVDTTHNFVENDTCTCVLCTNSIWLKTQNNAHSNDYKREEDGKLPLVIHVESTETSDTGEKMSFAHSTIPLILP